MRPGAIEIVGCSSSGQCVAPSPMRGRGGKKRADNARAIKLYERAGFQHEAVKRNAMHFDGVYYDAVQMSILLA
jgi:hypothetical protein